MMTGFGGYVGGVVVAALLVTGSVPAQAAVSVGPAGWTQSPSQEYRGRDRWGGRDRYRHRRHHRGDGIDAGDVIAGAAVVGVLAVLLNSASKSKADRDQRDRDYDRAPPPRASDRDAPGYPADGGYAPTTGPTGGQTGSGIISGETAAVDACAVAAEQEAARIGPNPSVRNIETVDGTGREWRIGGTVETRDGYRASPTTHRFDCSIRYGQIERVDIDQGALASR